MRLFTAVVGDHLRQAVTLACLLARMIIVAFDDSKPNEALDRGRTYITADARLHTFARRTEVEEHGIRDHSHIGTYSLPPSSRALTKACHMVISRTVSATLCHFLAGDHETEEHIPLSSCCYDVSVYNYHDIDEPCSCSSIAEGTSRRSMLLL